VSSSLIEIVSVDGTDDVNPVPPAIVNVLPSFITDEPVSPAAVKLYEAPMSTQPEPVYSLATSLAVL